MTHSYTASQANTYTSSDQFTATSSKGICILLVKDDTACNNIVSDMLQHCSYEVLNSGGALDVVDAIWEIKDGLELILTNIHKLGFNGIEIARHLQKKFHLPIVLMSPDKKKIENEKGQPFRIAAYVLNGLSRSDVGSLWQRACRKEGEKTVCNNAVENKTEDSLSVDETMFHDHRGEKRKESIDDYQRKRFIEDEHGRNKKPRVVWTAEMHRKFLEAIHILGHDKAVPKKIVEVMNTPGLTRENVASHLQKYRGGLKRTAQEITLSSLSDSFRTTMDKPFHVLMRRDSFPTQTRCSTTQIPYDSNDAPLVKAKDDYCYTLRSILDSSRTYPKDHFSRFDDQRKMEKLPHISVPTDDSPSGEFNFVGIRLASDGNSIKFGKLDDALKENGQIRVKADFLAPQASGDDVITTGCVQQSATLDQNSSVSQNQSAQWIPGNETVSSIDLSLLLWEIKNSSPGQDISGEALKMNAKDHILLRDSPEKETGFDDLSIPELIFPSGNDFLPKAIEARMDDFRVLLQDDMSQQQCHYSPSQMLQVTSDFIEETEVDDSLINTMLSTSSPEFDWEEFCGTIFNNDS